jgi:hypothetical protein
MGDIAHARAMLGEYAAGKTHGDERSDTIGQ